MEKNTKLYKFLEKKYLEVNTLDFERNISQTFMQNFFFKDFYFHIYSI